MEMKKLNSFYTLPSKQVMEVLEDEEGQNLRRNFTLYKDGVMRCMKEQWMLPSNFQYFAKLVYNFGFHSSDIMILSYPKSGTTWMQEIVWNLLHNPDLNNPLAHTSIDSRTPSIHGDMILRTTGVPQVSEDHDITKRFRKFFPGKDPSEGIMLMMMGLQPPPRIIKTHLPLVLFPPELINKIKIIYIARDPRDVINSSYHFYRLFLPYGFKGSKDEFIDFFLKEQVCFGPYWLHISHIWEKRDNPNILFLFYENLKKNTVAEVEKIDKFLGTNRTEKQIQNVVDFTTFSALKNRSKNNPPSSNNLLYFNKEVINEGGFYRKGEVNDWKNHFSDTQVEKIEKWMKEGLQQFGSDFKYRY